MSHITTDLSRNMSIPLAPNKTVGPETTIEFLGIIIDTANMQLQLPQRKREDLREILHSFRGRKTASKQELQSLAGKLQHAATVIKPGRCFIRNAYELAAIREKPQDRIRLNREFRADIEWWSSFIDQWNGVSLLWNHIKYHYDVSVFSDASGSWGCGALFHNRWLQHQWPTDMDKSLSIVHKELIPVILAAAAWGSLWSGKIVQFVSDNEAVVIVLNKLVSKDKMLLHLLRCLVFIAAKHSFWFTGSHIQGRANILADAISRNRMDLFHSQAPRGMNPVPNPLHRELPYLLYGLPPDWLSPVWIRHFASIMQLV